MDAILAATNHAASTLVRGHELGTIEHGKYADLVVVAGNPLEAIAATRQIKMVIKGGDIIVNRLEQGRPSKATRHTSKKTSTKLSS
jgi:imidazolonepropionase-like amidohydrolase